MSTYHVPVLLKEALDLLNINNGDIVVDCTLGGGGHTKAFLDRVGNGLLISLDRDLDAINYVVLKLQSDGLEFIKYKLGDFDVWKSDHICIVHANYSSITSVLKIIGIDKVDKVFMDLGISSYQIDTPHRGFSFKSPGAKLDMRMGNCEIDAIDVLNNYNEKDLEYILSTYGHETYSKKISKLIIEKRKNNKIEFVSDIISILDEVYPLNVRKNDKNYPNKVFQAIRIEVNREFEHLQETLGQIPFILKDNGVFGVITFHGIEERLIKQIMKIFGKNHDLERFIQCGFNQYGNIGAVYMENLTKDSILPSEDEVRNNSRSRSAKLKAWKCRYL